MEIKEAIEHAIDGNAVLFLGAGFSFGSENVGGNLPLSGRSLAKKLYELAGVDTDDDNLSLASQMFLRNRSASELASLLRDMFTIKNPAPYHLQIASMNWRRIYTTNYDNLFELSANKEGKAVTPVIVTDPPEKHISDNHVCVHINGFIQRLEHGDLENNFKLTFESYLRDDFTPSKWKTVFQNDIALARAVIFIGYSMYDLDIQRIVDKEEIREKAIFIVSPDTKPTSPDGVVLPTFGQLFPIGVKAFGDEIGSLKSTYIPQTRPQEFLALHKVLAPAPIEEVKNTDVERLFLYGEVQPKLIPVTSKFPNLPSGRFYLVERQALAIAEQSIKDRDVIFTSDLGNGKTIALEQLAINLVKKGWNVFRLESDTKDTRREVDRLLRSNDPVLFMADPYIPFLDIIDFISVRRQGKQIRFALAARSNIHEAFLDRLENSLRTTDLVEIDLNRLATSEIKCLSELIHSFGLWADFSAYPDNEKIKILAQKCDSQFHQVLLQFYSSPQISKKIGDLFEGINEEVKAIAIAAFILKGTGLSVEKRFLNDLLDGSPLLRLSNSDKASLRFLWGDQSGQLQLKSSVLAEYYLTHMAEAADVIKVLSQMFTNAHKLQSITKEYVYFMRSVMSFSALQKLLPKEGFRNATIEFYEQIQTFRFTQRNPHYWLQYAIARLSLEDDLDAVETYFKSAYSFANSSGGYDTFQIDNHYARFLLAKAIRSTTVSEAFKSFDESQQILKKQMNRELKHYPYRVAKNVLDFYRVHKMSFSALQLKEVMAFCNDVLAKIEKLPRETRDHRHVVEAKNALETALKEA